MPNDVTAVIQRRARELLSSGQVVMLLGYRPGRSSAQPAFITRPEDASLLVFDQSCGPNLAAFLPKVKHLGRIGVVAKGCDSRSIVLLLQEHQLRREDVFILGVGCNGVLQDSRLSDSCQTCQFPNPVIYDELIGEPAAASGQLKAAGGQQSADSGQRWQWFKNEVSRCIRCYACRQVCPSCYCPICFVDTTMPSWVGRTTRLSDNMLFHIIRALHMAGRCVECGACSRACPMAIDLMSLNRKVSQIVKERFGHIAGLRAEEKPPLTVFDPDDRQEFII
ncbi:MAG: 4Fe-4S dicluster domain-containing protein [candidate division WOR-3 bacterium]